MATHIPPVQNINVLLVEDSRRDALLTRWQLSAIDDEFFFYRAGTLKDALIQMEQHSIDVLVLDLGLPDSDGLHSLDVLTEQFPTLPIVVLSGRSDEVATLSALQHGAQEFLIKGECSGIMIRQAMRAAIFRKSLNQMVVAHHLKRQPPKKRPRL
jgi:DNA-binding NarL/FixJ family response regulator